MNNLILKIIFMLSVIAHLPADGKIQIRLASIAPQSTDWGRALDRMTKEWAAATGGQVELIVYHNGMLGSDESEMLKKLRVNQIQGAVFTSLGMNGITKKVFTLSAPFLIRNDNEMDYILEKLGGELEETIVSSGFQLVAWSRVGWIRFFSRRPVSVPSDLKQQILGGSNDSQELQNLLKSMGYTIIVVANTDMLAALSTGKVDSYYVIPAYAAAMQIFGTAKNMLPLDIAPVMGGMVINQMAWRRIPDKYKSKLLEISRRIAKENDGGARKLNDNAVEIMKRNGLVVSAITPAQGRLWFDEAEQAITKTISSRSSALDADIYRRTNALLRDYRTLNPQGR